MIRTPLRIAGGALLVLVGIVGLILPIMPGWVFVLAGLTMLAPHSFGQWVKKRLQAAKDWYLRKRTGRRGAERGKRN